MPRLLRHTPACFDTFPLQLSRVASSYESYAHILKHLGTSLRQFQKPLVEVAGISMDCFVIILIVLHDSCILNVIVTHGNPVNLLCSIANNRNWSLISLRIWTQNL